MLRKLTLVLAIATMLAATLTTNHPAIASPDMQTITLNTGFNHATQHKYDLPPTPPALDAYWSVIKDPISGAGHRPANVINKHQVWNLPQGESQWISYSTNGSQGIKQGAYYYQKCFCLTRALWDNKEAILQSSLDLSVMADDAFSVGLNTTPDPGVPATYILKNGSNSGGFTGPPAKTTITGQKLVQMLRPGPNCLTVRVDDIGGVITGFDLMGSLTTTGIDGIAQAVPPSTTPQFNSCSSCNRVRLDREMEMNDSNVREGLVRPPE